MSYQIDLYLFPVPGLSLRPMEHFREPSSIQLSQWSDPIPKSPKKTDIYILHRAAQNSLHEWKIYGLIWRGVEHEGIFIREMAWYAFKLSVLGALVVVCMQ
jgi:hypothetical protein